MPSPSWDGSARSWVHMLACPGTHCKATVCNRVWCRAQAKHDGEGGDPGAALNRLLDF